MVRIHHTADVHLTLEAEERHAAIKTVLDQAATEDADRVMIGGRSL
jgi:DNA repair exonuclease SbcCD nuclease subunit